MKTLITRIDEKDKDKFLNKCSSLNKEYSKVLRVLIKKFNDGEVDISTNEVFEESKIDGRKQRGN